MSAARDGWRELVLIAADTAQDVRHLRLAPAGGEPLWSYQPGSHVVIDAGGATNAYSLTGEYQDPAAYELSVLRLAEGSGGSRWVHDELAIGDRVWVSPPRSTFPPITNARHHVLIAGGIGVTPILSHVRAAVRLGRSFEVLYAHRPGRGAHVGELTELAGDRLRVITDQPAVAPAVAAALADQPLGAMVYVCGPNAMMDMVLATAAGLGWPPDRLHTEAFSIGDLAPGEPFVARLRSTGREIAVASGVSLLEALEADGVEVSSLCRQGVCGECRVGVTAGVPLHRDLFLTEEEHAAGDCVMCCVSRARGDLLELAL
jgi:dimethylamine monooxygenase subunit B